MRKATGGPKMTRVPRLIMCALLVAVAGASIAAQVAERASAPRAAQHATYVPTRDTWETRKPAEVGMDEALLNSGHRVSPRPGTPTGRKMTTWPTSFKHLRPAARPVPQSHGRTNGIILRHGYIVARIWRHERRRTDLQRGEELPVDHPRPDHRPEMIKSMPIPSQLCQRRRL